MQQVLLGRSKQYGVLTPDHMTPYPVEVSGHSSQFLGDDSSQKRQQKMAEEVPPINSRPPPPMANVEEFASTVSGNFNDEDALTAGDDTERGMTGSRWPREETLALIKIRSEMDAVFREANLKGPLWDEVSRKLAEQGYARSSKKCKEKFENVHKYYKRTKEGRAGRQDGKNYRFFDQLEALNNIGGRGCNSSAPPRPHPAANPLFSSAIGFDDGGLGNKYQSTHLSSTTPLIITAGGEPPEIGLSSSVSLPVSGGGISLSTYSSSTSSSGSDGEEIEEGMNIGGKRKRRNSSGRGGRMSKKTVAYVKSLMKKLMDQQEAMQQKFLETIEKREHDRMIREEAWKRQEMVMVAKEHEAMAAERAVSATRDAAIVALLQKITGHVIQFPQPTRTSTLSAISPPPPRQNGTSTPPPLKEERQKVEKQTKMPVIKSAVVVHDHQQGNEMGTLTDPTPSRWPKTEVLALIKLRSELDCRYQDVGPKGPLWEEISMGMKEMGYNRNQKRCKEKWENINKYFKKVKESKKKRPEDAKTCPYFHQLDALYREKSTAVNGVDAGNTNSSFDNVPAASKNSGSKEQEYLSSTHSAHSISTLPLEDPLEHLTEEIPVNGSNGALQASFLGQKGSNAENKREDDTVREPNAEERREFDDNDSEEEEQKTAYKNKYQMRPNNDSTNMSNGGGTKPSATAASDSVSALVK